MRFINIKVKLRHRLWLQNNHQLQSQNAYCKFLIGREEELCGSKRTIRLLVIEARSSVDNANADFLNNHHRHFQHHTYDSKYNIPTYLNGFSSFDKSFKHESQIVSVLNVYKQEYIHKPCVNRINMNCGLAQDAGDTLIRCESCFYGILDLLISSRHQQRNQLRCLCSSATKFLFSFLKTKWIIHPRSNATFVLSKHQFLSLLRVDICFVGVVCHLGCVGPKIVRFVRLK